MTEQKPGQLHTSWLAVIGDELEKLADLASDKRKACVVRLVRGEGIALNR